MSAGVVAVLEARAPGRSDWWVLASDPLVDVVENRLLFGTLVGRVTAVPTTQPTPAPRGFPDDATEATRARAAEWGSLRFDQLRLTLAHDP
jgi:hypothetical protein